jgi:hypothetical protein
MSDDDKAAATREWLKNHPRLIGYMFAVMLAWSSVGTAAAANWGNSG